MNNNINLDNAVRKIQSDELDIETFVNEAENQGDRNDFLKFIRLRLADKSYLKERSIYCGLIREFNDKDSLPIIWELIGKEETKGRRGSLVFAMENMNPVEYLEQLVELIINDNLEVLSNSMDIIDNLEGYVDGDTLDKCISKIKSALTQAMPEWRKKALDLLLEEFEEE